MRWRPLAPKVARLPRRPNRACPASGTGSLRSFFWGSLYSWRGLPRLDLPLCSCHHTQLESRRREETAACQTSTLASSWEKTYVGHFDKRDRAQLQERFCWYSEQDAHSGANHLLQMLTSVGGVLFARHASSWIAWAVTLGSITLAVVYWLMVSAACWPEVGLACSYQHMQNRNLPNCPCVPLACQNSALRNTRFRRALLSDPVFLTGV